MNITPGPSACGTGTCPVAVKCLACGPEMLGCMIETSIPISAAAYLAELCDYLDLDGNILISNDPYRGVTAEKGILSFAAAPETFGLRVVPK